MTATEETIKPSVTTLREISLDDIPVFATPDNNFCDDDDLDSDLFDDDEF